MKRLQTSRDLLRHWDKIGDQPVNGNTYDNAVANAGQVLCSTDSDRKLDEYLSACVPAILKTAAFTEAVSAARKAEQMRGDALF